MVDPQRRRDALFDRRFTALVQAGAALSTIGTWDDGLSRRTRILVPVDVQAFVVPVNGGEATVAMTGGPGDPPPFEPGSVRPAGVHLHWAMPDALVAGASDPTGEALDLPRLPDRWVVVRTLQPLGSREARPRGWVIDARTGSVTPLATYAGTPDPAPPDTPVLEPLDAAAGGSLMWTASYEASAGRFGFHDPLDDLTTGEKFAGDQAAYTVAGWWSDLGEDPLAATTGPRRLDARLADLGWYVVHDADDEALVEEDPRLTRIRDGMGMPSPKDAAPARITGADGRIVSGALDDIAFTVRSPVRAADLVVMTPALPRYATLVHGSVLGVPVTGALPPADDRPDAADLGLALGQDVDDVVSAFGAEVLGLDATLRRSAETLVAAFTSGLIEQIGSPDGLEDLAEREHGDGFWSLPGAPLPAAKPDRLRTEDTAPLGPTRVGRKGRAAQPPHRLGTRLGWADVELTLTSGTGAGAAASRRTEETLPAPGGTTPSESREVIRPAPRYFRPQPPMLAMRGVRPNHRHHGDGLYDEQGRLRCRYPRECVPAIDGVITGTAVLGSLGSGAVPDEVLTVVREAVLLNLYGFHWLAEAGAPDASMVEVYRTRLAAEMVRLYGVDGRYDGTSHLAAAAPAPALAPGDPWEGRSTRDELLDRQITAELAEHALVRGTPPSPVAITTWRQPWVPLWLEWKVTLDGHGSTAGWQLAGLDLEPTTDPPTDPGAEVSRPLVGRSPLSQGVSRALYEGIRRWREAELQRDATGNSTLPTSDQDLLGRLGDLLAPLDLVSASLDGLREQLLGIPYVGVLHSAEDNDSANDNDGSDGADSLPRATGAPVPLFGGTLRIDALRLVDAFGRVLDIPPEAVAGTATTLDLAVEGLAGGIRMRPRIQHLARALFRLVDPGQPAGTDPAELREAYVDQLDPAAAVNPVAGFLLPDHIDEALEAFTAAGEPIGQLGHDAVNGAVTWETAPGRPLPPDAGPLAGLDAQTRITGEIAAGLVHADVAARDLDPPPGISALSALLRVIDTTLWTVDTFAAIGSPTVAGLVGRPVTVVRATLRLDAPDDLDEVDVVAPGGPAARRAAYDAMREQRFAFRLGALSRTDDALLGFYLDDDYAHLRLVDRTVAAQAIDSGRQRGHLGLLGQVAVPDVDPLVHPYVVPDGTIWLRPGQTARLTLLMLPVGRVHLTSGVLPRKQLTLSDEWTSPGLRRLVPSVRVGPVLVDPAEIRLPLVTLLGDKQTFTRRTGPLTWRDDPIVAATQTAYLPRLPHEAQEGWIRVTPTEPGNGPGNPGNPGNGPGNGPGETP
ncbi:hypothetical protein ABN028_20600 [Actinopolymorpha sp. B17G11]|uniref:hypothetical protein n=1 Tax=Actinopolymorpha sp. B17G11 TaxID=3160861 RepID=UPI0032E3C34D